MKKASAARRLYGGDLVNIWNKVERRQHVGGLGPFHDVIAKTDPLRSVSRTSTVICHFV